MALAMMAWLFAIPLLGFATGLRTMTPIAVLCWFAYRGNLAVHHGWGSWTTHLASAVVFSILALGEYIGDKLPQTPNRTAPFPLAARIIFGGLVGALAATGLKGPIAEGAILGALGAFISAFAAFWLRRDLVKRTGWPDWTIGLAGDATAIVCSVYAMGIITG